MSLCQFTPFLKLIYHDIHAFILKSRMVLSFLVFVFTLSNEHNILQSISDAQIDVTYIYFTSGAETHSVKPIE